MTGGRFPPPWTVEVTPNRFIVRDANWQALSYVYYESNPGRRSAAKLLSKDETRRIAVNIAKLRRINPITRPLLTFCQKLSASGSVCSAVVVLSHGKKNQMLRKTLIILTAIAGPRLYRYG